MEAFTGSPLTLVVKAPNQEIGDQTVECFLDWTVQKLKRHLSSVYPTNPHERSQRIIYSGKLLQDNVLLKDVLTVGDTRDKCTVHLVCTPTAEEMARPKGESTQHQRPTTVLHGSSSTDGLRQRIISSSTSTMTSTAPVTLEQQQQYHHPSSFSTATSLPSPVSGAPAMPHSFSFPGTLPAASMSPQQLQWMQHLYAQQMYAAHQMTYMQQYAMMAAGSSGQPGWAPTYSMPSPWPQATPHPATTTTTPINQAHHQHHHHHRHQPAPPAGNQAPGQGAAVAPGGLNQNPPAAPQGPQRMNVGGGGVMDDDQDEGMRRDWLDWTFTLCRFGILLSIVYFYSSLNRFLVVAGAMFFMYLYQAGFFQLRRRVRPPVTPPQQPPAPQEEGAQEDGVSEGNDSQSDESDGSSSSSDDADGTGSGAATEPQEPARPGILTTAWVFVSTFFTSIIPQGPAQPFPAN